MSVFIPVQKSTPTLVGVKNVLAAKIPIGRSFRLVWGKSRYTYDEFLGKMIFENTLEVNTCSLSYYTRVFFRTLARYSESNNLRTFSCNSTLCTCFLTQCFTDFPLYPAFTKKVYDFFFIRASGILKLCSG